MNKLDSKVYNKSRQPAASALQLRLFCLLCFYRTPLLRRCELDGHVLIFGSSPLIKSEDLFL